MSTEKNTAEHSGASGSSQLICPKCGSTKIAGLMQSFWVELDSDETMKGNWNDYEGCSELGEERLCSDCGNEF